MYWLVVYQPLWKIWKSVGIILPNIRKNKKKCSKPPTSIYIYMELTQKSLEDVETNHFFWLGHCWHMLYGSNVPNTPCVLRASRVFVCVYSDCRIRAVPFLEVSSFLCSLHTHAWLSELHVNSILCRLQSQSYVQFPHFFLCACASLHLYPIKLAHTHTYTYIYIYIHIYIHKHIHIFICTYIVIVIYIYM